MYTVYMSYNTQTSFFEQAYLTGTDVWSHSPLYAHTVAYLQQIPTQGVILDVGCGRGEWAFVLGAMGRKVIGIDVIEKVITTNKTVAEMRNLKGQVGFVVGSVFDIPFQNSSFSSVVDIELLQHVLPQDREVYAKEIDRVLAPGGLVFLSQLSKQTPFFMGARPSSMITGSIEVYGVYYHFFSPTELQALFPSYNVVEQSEMVKDMYGDPTHMLFMLLQKPVE